MKEQERKKRKNSMQQPEETSASGADADTATANAVAGSAAVATAGGGGSSSVWPHQAAERVRLLVPDEYKTAQEKQQQQQQQQQQNDNEKPLYCHLHYHAARNVLLVVMKSEITNDNDDDENETMILDVIHANDLIGADISVELTAEAATADTNTMDTSSPPSSPRNTSNHHGGNDNDNNIDEDNNNANGSTDNNDDSHHGRATNEPPSDSLHDHRGHAILSLYVYPRQDPATCSWLYRMGITSYYAPPGPPPRQSLTAFLKEHQQQQQEQEALLLQAGQPRFAHVRKFILAPAEDLSGIPTLLAAIRQLAKPTMTTTTTTKQSSDVSSNHNDKKYLIIVNPKSGPKKNAATICQTLVLPMLQQAGVAETKLVITTHPHHAKELMSAKFNSNNSNNIIIVKKKEKHDDENANDDDDINILDYNGIILMGGDGIMHEVLNGIMQRPDAHHVLQKITLGIVGCGSCNGLAATIAHASHEAIGNLVNQVFLIAKGYQGVRMDISRYQTISSSSYSFLTFAYGLIADIDIESELLHWLGEVRIDLWAVWRVLFSLRRYRARFSYLPPCPSGTTTTALLLPDGILPESVTDPLPTSGNDDNNNDENKYGWKTLSSNNDEDDDDDYNNGIILFWASQVSHAAEHTHQAPDSQLQDGLFKVMLIRNTKTITKWQVARILLALASGKHVELAGVEFIDCIAYRLEPLDKKNKKDLNVLDGEVIESGPIQAQVLPSMVRIFCNPPTPDTPSN